jgi:hypothetical protein
LSFSSIVSPISRATRAIWSLPKIAAEPVA